MTMKHQIFINFWSSEQNLFLNYNNGWIRRGENIWLIQNEILKILANSILREILDNVRGNIFSIMADQYTDVLNKEQLTFCESVKWCAQRSHVPYVLTHPTCPPCPRAQVYFTDRKIKNIGFNEIRWRFVHWCFQGCWILIWTLIKISFFKIGSKNIKLFYAEGQSNTYKCWRSKQHLQNN